MKLSKLTSKGFVTKAAGLGAGAVVGEIVNNKVGEKLPAAAQKFSPALSIIAGAFLSSSRSQFVKESAAGMIATGMAQATKSILPDETKTQLGIGEVMLGVNDVMLGMDEPRVDFTSGAAGESNY